MAGARLFDVTVGCSLISRAAQATLGLNRGLVFQERSFVAQLLSHNFLVSDSPF